jgi:hypothetical protein
LLLLGGAELGAERGPDARLEVLVVLARLGPELPLVAEQGGLVDVARDVVERDALGDPRTDERRREDLRVGRDVGAGRDVDVLDRLL